MAAELIQSICMERVAPSIAEEAQRIAECPESTGERVGAWVDLVVQVIELSARLSRHFGGQSPGR